MFKEISVLVPIPVPVRMPMPVDEEEVGSFENRKVLASFSDLEEGHPIVIEIRPK